MSEDVIRIVPEELTPEAIAPFGQALVFGDASAASSGAWWTCWEGAAELSAGRQWVGFVRASAGCPDITEMEREMGTELIIPTNAPVLQVVAPTCRDAEGRERPDARHGRAFILRPGTALLINPRVWHAAAFGLQSDASYFYIAERRLAATSEGRGGWVEFAESLRLRTDTTAGSPSDG